uniref:Cysteine protease n=1 Tax=Astyanax mexicanus TaxID=7994 RepID=A0A8B9KEQ1_ASTMX
LPAATLTYDTLRFGEFEDFPETPEPVWILGKQFNALKEKDDILSDITSRMWFTYRKNFQPIGGTGPTSDTGWGCMLRCGQMILAEALIRTHLGRDWRWVAGQRQREEYISILNAFIDKKDSYYSIHQIAQMGVGEGKSIGQWYGPNTVAQVLKKLTVFDTWSRLVIHVAMDNTVVIEEIKKLCMPWLDFERGACAEPGGPPEMNGCLEGACALAEEALWKPLVLLIPLRLGLSDINEAYIETLKVRSSTVISSVDGLERHVICWCSLCFIKSKVSAVFSLKICNILSNTVYHSADFSDSDRLERFFDSEDEEFEILSL